MLRKRHHHHKPPRPTKRAAEVGEAVARLGLQFNVEDHLHLDRLPFTFFRTQDVRQVGHAAWGTCNGMSVWVFDAWVRSRGGPHLTCAATVLTAGFPGLAVIGVQALPDPQDLDGLGYQLVHPPQELAERFDVVTADPAFADDLLQPELVTWLGEAAPDERFETTGPYLLVGGPPAGGDGIGELLERLAAFRAHLPQGLAARYPPSVGTAAPRRQR